MLVLTRRNNEQIVIADNITVRVLKTQGERVKIGIEAPADVFIRRAECPPNSPVDCPEKVGPNGETVKR